jgi:hypothetical protein
MVVESVDTQYIREILAPIYLIICRLDMRMQIIKFDTFLPAKTFKDSRYYSREGLLRTLTCIFSSRVKTGVYLQVTVIQLGIIIITIHHDILFSQLVFIRHDNRSQ